MDFYNNQSIIVTDTTFVTPNGDQYPIRNITSVQVREKNYWIILMAAFVFLLPSLLGIANGANLTSTLPGIMMAGAFGIWWYFSRVYILWIGSGGIIQKALSFPKRKSGSLENLIEISKAINQSIANLQSPK